MRYLTLSFVATLAYLVCIHVTSCNVVVSISSTVDVGSYLLLPYHTDSCHSPMAAAPTQSATTTTSGGDDVKESKAPASFARRNHLLEIEGKIQADWAKQKAFEVDAPDVDSKEAKAGKYFATFPYPYMNGVLHLGHAFTISKAEFATRFQALLGKKVLFPFGFHCTGNDNDTHPYSYHTIPLPKSIQQDSIVMMITVCGYLTTS
jgi:hypothetical protein